MKKMPHILFIFFKRLSAVRSARYVLLWFSVALFWQTSFSQQHIFDRFNHVSDQSELKPGETKEGKVKKNFFLRAEVTKTECYVGECIMATFKAYSRLNANSQVVKRPSLSGFSVMEMVDAYSNEPDIEKVNGKYYYVHLIRKVQLIPLQSGTFELEGAEVESTIHFRRPTDDSPIISLRDFLRKATKRNQENDEDLDYHVSLETPPISIRVLPLPEASQPEEYSGAVGNFSVSAQMPDTRIRQNEPAIFRLMLRGSGNFPLINEPAIQWPKGVDVSQPVISEDINKYVFPLSGSKVFEYTLHSAMEGTQTIPPVRIDYFDPSSKSYKAITTDAANYKVVEGKKSLPADLSEETRKTGYSTPLQWYWFGGVAFLIICWVMYQFIRARNDKKKSTTVTPENTIPTAGVARKIADSAAEIPTALQRLENIRLVKEALNNNDRLAFYDCVKKSIWEAVAEKYHTPPSQLTRRSMMQLFQKDVLPEPEKERIVALLDECDLALYAHGQSQAELLNTYLELETALTAITPQPGDR